MTRYKLKVSFLSLMLLHEDPPATPSDAMDPGQTSAEKLRIMAEQFFGRVPGISTSGVGPELNQIRDQFTEACPFDHLRYFINQSVVAQPGFKARSYGVQIGSPPKTSKQKGIGIRPLNVNGWCELASLLHKLRKKERSSSLLVATTCSFCGSGKQFWCRQTFQRIAESIVKNLRVSPRGKEAN